MWLESWSRRERYDTLTQDFLFIGHFCKDHKQESSNFIWLNIFAANVEWKTTSLSSDERHLPLVCAWLCRRSLTDNHNGQGTMMTNNTNERWWTTSRMGQDNDWWLTTMDHHQDGPRQWTTTDDDQPWQQWITTVNDWVWTNCLLKSNVSWPRLNCTYTPTVLMSADIRLRAAARAKVFTLPHVFHMDSSGLQWIPVPIFPGQIGWYNAWSTEVQSTGLQATFQSPVPVQWTESPVKVHWSLVESTGLDTVPCIVQNINTSENWTLTSTTHHMHKWRNNITASPCGHYKIMYRPWLILLWLGHTQIERRQTLMLDLDIVSRPQPSSSATTIIHDAPRCASPPSLIAATACHHHPQLTNHHHNMPYQQNNLTTPHQQVSEPIRAPFNVTMTMHCCLIVTMCHIVTISSQVS